MNIRRLCVVAALVVVFSLAAKVTVSSLIGGSSNVNAVATPPARSSSSAAQATLPLGAKIDLGVIVQGKSAELSCWIRNQGTGDLQLSKIESSCECLEIHLSKMHIAAGERILAHAHYDGAKESDFAGSLQIEVQLIDDKGTKVGQIDVPIEVIRADAN